jgi:hypothetical protein
MDKVQHLKLIQAVVTRMAGNSFLLKGWTVTLISALLAFAAKDADRGFIAVVWIPVLPFVLLDSYYLWQERLFRDLYDRVRQSPATTSDFAMGTTPGGPRLTWPAAFFSRTILIFYGTVVLVLAVASAYSFWGPANRPAH